MAKDIARSRYEPLAIGRHPIYPLVLPIPVLCFLGALLTDLAYQGSGGNLLWVNFSSWLIATGLVFGGIAAIILLIESLRSSRFASLLLLVAAWIVELINSFVHARDGWTAVVPLGILLSVVAAILVLAGAWVSQSRRYAEARL